MSDLPLFPISLTDDDHVLRLMSDLIQWPEPGAQQRATAFFKPEDPEDSVLESIFAPLRAQCRPIVRTAGTSPAGARVLVSRRGAVDAAALSAAGRVTLVQRLGERPKGLDIAACHSHGAQVSLLPRHSLEHVADHTLLLILATLRRLPAAQAALHAHGGPAGARGQVSYNWPGVTGLRALSGLTLGIVGLGEIGLRVARRAQAFGMQILWCAPEGSSPTPEAADWTRLDLATLLGAADVVTLHVPPAGLNGPLIGAVELARMKPGAVLVNTARGALVDETALARALHAGHLSGAALDVHGAEPPDPASPLRARQDVLLTPHVAGGSRQEVLREMAALCDNFVDALNGLPPRHGHVAA